MRKFKLPELPFGPNDLKGLSSAETFEFHHGKHHKAYIDKMNEMLEKDSSFGGEPSLEELVMKTEGGLFNQAGQSWNHTFFWHCMSPEKPAIENDLKSSIEKKFGSLDQFKTEFVNKGVANFGSGWTWLVKDNKGELDIVNTSNAGNPMRESKIPLLVADVWEHAYYIDHRNARKAFLEKFLENVNWNFVAENFKNSKPANMTQFMV